MQSIPVFPVILKIADFSGKITDDSRIRGVCHLIYVFLSSLGKV